MTWKAESFDDPYLGWRASLRETMKWYVAGLTGLGTLLAGGMSLAILPELSGQRLIQGLWIGGAVLVCFLLALWRITDTLTVRPFDYGKIARMHRELSLYVREKTTYVDFAALETALTEAEDAATRDEDSISSLANARLQVISFASYLSLQKKVLMTNLIVLGLFLLICLGVGRLTWLQAQAKSDAGGEKVAVRFLPGDGWRGYADALAATCAIPAGGMVAKGVADQPFAGWWTITLEGPDCKGAVISVPDAVIATAP